MPSSKSSLRARSKAVSRAIADLHGTVAGHAEALLVEPAVGVAQRVGGRLVGTGEPRPEHHVGRAGGERQGDVAGIAHAAVGPDVLAVSAASAAHSSTALNCGRPTPVIIRVVHIAPGPTPTFTTSAPALIRSRVSLCGHHVAGDDRRVGGDGANLLDGPQRARLVAVSGVDHQHVGAHRQQRLGLRGRVAIDADRNGDAQPAVTIDGRLVDRRAQRTLAGDASDQAPRFVDHRCDGQALTRQPVVDLVG